MKVRYDCIHFDGSRPCGPHKEHGVHCARCAHYRRVKSSLMVIKLGAPGDVLRTTGILAGLHAKYPGARVTWCTRKEAAPFLVGNPLVAEILVYDTTRCLTEIARKTYDLVLSLDVDVEGASLAEMASGRRKVGFGFSRKGHLHPFNPEAKTWFEMSLWDDLKRANRRTYQALMMELCRLPGKATPPLLFLSDEERRWARDYARRKRIHGRHPVIGLNTGADARWERKQWTEEGFRSLIALIRKQVPGSVVLLYGGPAERDRNRRLAAGAGRNVIDTGADNDLRRFCSLVGLCDVLVTGDTMALHAGVALGKEVVALFGPTSAAEIDLFGHGVKVAGEMDCLVCYRSRCDRRRHCMEAIRPATVFEAVKNACAGLGLA